MQTKQRTPAVYRGAREELVQKVREMNNYLLVVLAISCSSDGYKFDRVIVKDNCLYPVILKNKIAEGDAVTCDIIYWVYYAEVAAETGCSAGEILYEYR